MWEDFSGFVLVELGFNLFVCGLGMRFCFLVFGMGFGLEEGFRIGREWDEKAGCREG